GTESRGARRDAERGSDRAAGQTLEADARLPDAVPERRQHVLAQRRDRERGTVHRLAARAEKRCGTVLTTLNAKTAKTAKPSVSLRALRPLRSVYFGVRW